MTDIKKWAPTFEVSGRNYKSLMHYFVKTTNSREIFYKMILNFLFLIVLSSTAAAQSPILIEACNNISDNEKRLSCMQELIKGFSGVSSNDKSFDRVKNAFLGLQGAVNSGISYNAYAQQVVEPARALEIYKVSSNADIVVIDMFEKALQAYKDAQSLWRASIYESQDGGVFFGRVFNYRRSGFSGVVQKYNLPVTKILLNDHLSIDLALPLMWRQASEYNKMAIDRIEFVLSGGKNKNFEKNSNEVFLRTGIRLSDSLLILGVDEKFENSIFPLGGVLEKVGGQPVSNFEQLILVINYLPKDSLGYEALVNHNNSTFSLFLKIRSPGFISNQ